MAGSGHVRIPNDVFDRLVREPEKLAAWLWIERTRSFSDGAATVSISRIAGKFKKSRNWARNLLFLWISERGTPEVTEITGEKNRDRTRTPEGHLRDSGGTPEATDITQKFHRAGTAVGQRRDSEGTAEGHHTKKQETRNKKQLKAKTNTAYSLPDWIPKDLWDAWMFVRSKQGGADTPRAKDALVRRLTEARDAGHDITDVMETILVRRWIGLKLEWLDPRPRKSRQKSFAEIDDEYRAEQLKRRDEELAALNRRAEAERSSPGVVPGGDSGRDRTLLPYPPDSESDIPY